MQRTNNPVKDAEAWQLENSGYDTCDVCKEELYGNDGYDMPDGSTICIDCLRDWAKKFRRESCRC